MSTMLHIIKLSSTLNEKKLDISQITIENLELNNGKLNSSR